MHEITKQRLTQEFLLETLPPEVREPVLNAMASAKDWWLPDSSLLELQEEDYFFISDMAPVDGNFPDGYVYHGRVLFPSVRVCDGIFEIGYEGQFDCGDTIEEVDAFWSLEDLLPQLSSPTHEAMLEFFRQQVTEICEPTQEEYREWVKNTGKDPYLNQWW